MEKRIKRKKIYGDRIIKLHRDTVKIGKRKTIREVVQHPGSAVIIPFLAKDKIILIKQYRYAANSYLFELPAGTLEKNESPLSCAKREIIEETGYSAGKMKKIAVFYPSPGLMTEKMHLFKATRLKKKKQNTEFDEDIKVHITTVKNAKKMIKNGRIKDAKTIAGILITQP